MRGCQSNLSNLLFVDTSYVDDHLVISEVDTFWSFVLHFMAEAKTHGELVVATCDAETDTVDFEFLFEVLS